MLLLNLTVHPFQYISLRPRFLGQCRLIYRSVKVLQTYQVPISFLFFMNTIRATIRSSIETQSIIFSNLGSNSKQK